MGSDVAATLVVSPDEDFRSSRRFLITTLERSDLEEMILNKLISNSRHVLKGMEAAAVRRTAEGARSCHVVAINPRNKVSTGELFVMGAILVGSMWFTPFWVLYHLPDYQNEDRKTYTGK